MLESTMFCRKEKTMRRASVIALLSILVVCVGAGCKQTEGERCQLNSDCEGSLVCCIDQDHIDEGGRCCHPPRPDGGADAAGDGAPNDGAGDVDVDGKGTSDTGQGAADAQVGTDSAAPRDLRPDGTRDAGSAARETGADQG